MPRWIQRYANIFFFFIAAMHVAKFYYSNVYNSFSFSFFFSKRINYYEILFPRSPCIPYSFEFNWNVGIQQPWKVNLVNNLKKKTRIYFFSNIISKHIHIYITRPKRWEDPIAHLSVSVYFRHKETRKPAADRESQSWKISSNRWNSLGGAGRVPFVEFSARFRKSFRRTEERSIRASYKFPTKRHDRSIDLHSARGEILIHLLEWTCLRRVECRCHCVKQTFTAAACTRLRLFHFHETWGK